jgi:hypothetical protein
MKKNSQIHIYLETELRDRLQIEAKEEGLTISEYCRLILKRNKQLDRIEEMLKKLQ